MLPDNWPVLQIFLACQTQWNLEVGMGGAFYLGLNYPGVNIVLERCVKKRKKRDRLFLQLQQIERAALELINEKS